MKNKILQQLPFNMWHPEVAIRYLPIAKEIKQMGDVSVLEVGSGGLGVAPYLNRPVTGIDEDFSPPHHPLLNMVKGIGENLPFEDKNFDVVISVDTLEHVPPENREKVIAEIVRVAKKEIILAFPSGPMPIEQDQELSNVYQKKFGHEFHFLVEHLKYGLPDEQQVTKILKKLAGQKATLRVDGNENLKLRNFLMTGWMTKNPLVNLFFRKVLLLATPIFVRMQFDPYYRKIFYVKLVP